MKVTSLKIRTYNEKSKRKDTGKAEEVKCVARKQKKGNETKEAKLERRTKNHKNFQTW